jgi:precorrin-6B methylase 2
MSLETREKSSFRDPSSQVWTGAGMTFRDIHPCYFRTYKLLNDSGLYQELTERKLMVPHEHVSFSDYRITIRPEEIPFISYPYEWCFGNLKKAALTTLDVNIVALKHGMILKDASAFNIQFNGKWKLIDTTSFEKYEDGQPWMAYGQFMRHFVLPLVFCQYRGSRYLKLSQIYLDGFPLEMIRDLPVRSFLDLKTDLFVHSFRLARESKPRTLKKEYLVQLLERLKGYIEGLHCKREKGWSAYEPENDYTEAKKEAVRLALGTTQGNLLDIGANKGTYSLMATRMGKHVVAIDRDYDCVDMIPDVLSLVVDLSNPTPAIGWSNQERKSFLERARFDTVLALALIHHLCIGNNIPLEKVAEQLRWMTKDRLIIEFVPDTDEKALLLARDRIFPAYSQAIFEEEFGKRFTLRGKKVIGDSCRKLYIYSVR